MGASLGYVETPCPPGSQAGPREDGYEGKGGSCQFQLDVVVGVWLKNLGPRE